MTQGAPQEEDVPADLGVDPTRAEPGPGLERWAGGKDHFAADRELAERFGQVVPGMPLIARLTRGFIAHTVSTMAADGIRQFLDIGTGLPTADNTHEVAQRLAPGFADRLRGQRSGGARARPRSADQQPGGNDGVPGRRSPRPGQDPGRRRRRSSTSASRSACCWSRSCIS